MGMPLLAPGFNDLMGRNLKRTAIELLIASFDDSPVDGATQWTVFRVIALGENLIPAIVCLTRTYLKIAGCCRSDINVE